jgi:hypothetical protein
LCGPFIAITLNGRHWIFLEQTLRFNWGRQMVHNRADACFMLEQTIVSSSEDICVLLDQHLNLISRHMDATIADTLILPEQTL